MRARPLVRSIAGLVVIAMCGMAHASAPAERPRAPGREVPMSSVARSIAREVAATSPAMRLDRSTDERLGEAERHAARRSAIAAIEQALAVRQIIYDALAHDPSGVASAGARLERVDRVLLTAAGAVAWARRRLELALVVLDTPHGLTPALREAALQLAADAIVATLAEGRVVLREAARRRAIDPVTSERAAMLREVLAVDLPWTTAQRVAVERARQRIAPLLARLSHERHGRST